MQHDLWRAAVDPDRLQILDNPRCGVPSGVGQPGGRACSDSVVDVRVSISRQWSEDIAAQQQSNDQGQQQRDQQTSNHRPQ